MDTPTITQVSSEPFDIKINRHGYVAHIVFQGEINMAAINHAYLGLIDHPFFKYNMNVCNDYSKAFVIVSVQELQQHADFVAQYSQQRGNSYKLAMVSNETISSAFLNMYKVRISESKVDSELFGSTKSALRWLEN